MKILHVVAFALRGGCEKNCYHFITGSAQFEHEVMVLGEEGPMSPEWRALGVPVIHQNSLQLNLISFKKLLQRSLSNKKYDHVVCWSTVRLPLQLFALKAVTTDIHVYLGNPVGKNYISLKDILLQKIFPFLPSKVTLMACSAYVSKSYKNSSYYKEFQTEVALNPVALPTHFPQKHTDSSKFRLGMVARLDPIKDHATLLTGFAFIAKTIPTAELHLVGGGIMDESLRKQVKELELASSVFFHGDVQDVYRFLNEWDLFVYSTTDQEGLGSVVAEAMANGVPCVLSDLPMLRELAPLPELALWFKAGDAQALAAQVIFLYKNEAKRRNMASNSFKYAQQNFSSAQFIKHYLE